MGKVYFREVQAGDIAFVAANLRLADRQELMALKGAEVNFPRALATAVLISTHCWTAVGEEHTPIALFGAAPVSLLGGVGSPWLLGTEDTPRYGGALVRDARRYIALMKEAYPVMFNYVDARNTRSIQWLTRLGFKRAEPTIQTPEGLSFYRYQMEA